MRYKISNSLVIQFTRDSGMAASTSISQLPKKIETDGIHVLQAFGDGSTPGQAMKNLAEECEFEESGFKEVFEKLVQENFLVPADSAEEREMPSTLDKLELSLIRAHHIMLRDAIRVNAYRDAIFANVRGKSVVEIGCGTGILSLFAAQAGAKRVLAIEETKIAGLAKKMVRANGFENIIKVITGSSRNVELEEPADVIIHELIGTDPFEEGMLSSIADARERFFKDRNRLFIPGKIDICCAGIEIDEKDLVTREQEIKEAEEFGQQYALDFSPYIKELDRGKKFRSSFTNIPGNNFPYPVLSPECLLYSIDFLEEWGDISTLQTRTLEIKKPGNLNGVVIFFRAYLDQHTRLSNSPFSAKTHWGWNVRTLSRNLSVKPGDKVPLNTRLNQVVNRQMLDVDIA
jgi:predicted RNA methylase